MGRLIIDGNSVFEIDEDCVRRGRIPKDCNILDYLAESTSTSFESAPHKHIRSAYAPDADKKS